MSLEIGDKVPNFTITDQNGKDFTLFDHIGKQNIVLFFYPKDMSPVCTKEACGFRDNISAFEKQNTLVLGISKDNAASHTNFIQKQQLPYTLLSDSEEKALQAFQVKNTLFISGRETFVIDRAGILRFKYRAMLNGTGHVTKALAAIQKLEADNQKS